MHKNLILCLSVGTKYTDDYVRKLKSMLERHTTRAFDFVCYSDHDIEGIDVVRIQDPHRLDPLWYKLQMLDVPEIDQYQHKVFFDLDVVIHGNVDWVFDIHPTSLAILRSAWKRESEIHSPLNTGCNSSIMVWEDNAKQIYHKFYADADVYMIKYTGIDRFIWHEQIDWEALPADQVYSYRGGASLEDNTPFTPRFDRSVCIYNQYPKPHEAITEEPAKSHWV